MLLGFLESRKICWYWRRRLELTVPYAYARFYDVGYAMTVRVEICFDAKVADLSDWKTNNRITGLLGRRILLGKRQSALYDLIPVWPVHMVDLLEFLAHIL